ncbi:hypothetical protein SAMN06265365_101300 [Tistlia consotensis]|uniref:Uncharacterized protein n=1 Tax=Tistlia consotensis USBA 355 TaxID=560819 RepID=A0A1Y6B5A2_9PROT|nr:hypothetical protein [Tistlia consotensis]SME90341.1 hypothetical protein SAMN05428998_101298 [Tistlia consotensis USBA 355]SNR26630.1 hypothetical protein SAMN06265365_101300 [Tistlia consotensis]
MRARAVALWRHLALPAVIFLLWACAALQILTGARLFADAAGFCVALIAVAALATSRGMGPRVLAILGGGGLALAWLADDWPAALAGLDRAAAFAAFLGCLYALRGIVQASPALPTVQSAFVAFRPTARRGALQLLGLLFSVPLAIGAISIIAPLVAKEEDPAIREDIATWALRGVGLAVLFSPFTVCMGIVVSSLGSALPMAWLLIVGFATALLLAAIPHALGQCRLPRSLPRAFWVALWRVLAPVVLLIVANMTLVFAGGLTPVRAAILLVPLVGLAVTLRRDRAAQRQTAETILAAWRRFDAEIAIFVGSLVFAGVVTTIPEVREPVARLTELLGPGALIGATVLGIAVMASVGVHMVVTATILLTVFAPFMPDTPHLVLLGLAGLMGWAFGAMAAAGSLSFVAAVNILGVRARRLAFGPNLRFMAAAMLALGLVGLLLP